MEWGQLGKELRKSSAQIFSVEPTQSLCGFRSSRHQLVQEERPPDAGEGCGGGGGGGRKFQVVHKLAAE